MTKEELEQQVAKTLSIAADWNTKGDVRMELRCVRGAIDLLLTTAVVHCASAAEGTDDLRAQGCEDLLARHLALNTRLLELRGYENCWAPYLGLVEALTSGRLPASDLAACAESFARRNRDKRLTDWKQRDGDGRFPVRWDFRVPSILSRWRAEKARP